MVVRRGTHPRFVFEVWTATSSRIGDSRKWHGTYLELYESGEIYQVTRRADGTEDSICVMEGTT